MSTTLVLNAGGIPDTRILAKLPKFPGRKKISCSHSSHSTVISKIQRLATEKAEQEAVVEKWRGIFQGVVSEKVDKTFNLNNLGHSYEWNHIFLINKDGLPVYRRSVDDLKQAKYHEVFDILYVMKSRCFFCDELGTVFSKDNLSSHIKDKNHVISADVLDDLHAELTELEQGSKIVAETSQTSQTDELKQLTDSLEDEFQCVICFNYMTHPVCLPCGHWFDYSCWEQHKQSLEKVHATLECPMCREKFSNGLKVQESKPMMKIMETLIGEKLKVLKLAEQREIRMRDIKQALYLWNIYNLANIRWNELSSQMNDYEMEKYVDFLVDPVNRRKLVDFDRFQTACRRNPRKPGCRFCHSPDHIIWDCQDPRMRCRRCWAKGHSPWDPKCPRFLEEILEIE